MASGKITGCQLEKNLNDVDTQKAKIVDEEFNFWDFIENIRSNWRWPVVGGTFGFVGSAMFLLVLPHQYEASAVLQPAAIASFAPTVEPPINTLERLKTVTFYSDEIIETCQAASGKSLLQAINVKVIKGTNLITISHRGDSPAIAVACTEKIVKHLIELQAAIAAPLLKQLDEQKASTKKQIDDAERFLLQYEKRLKRALTSSDSVFLMLKSEELDKLQKLYREQSVTLTEPLTQPMKLMVPIYAPTDAVPRKPLLKVFGGFVAGLIVGLVTMFFNLSWHRHVDQRSSAA